MNKEFKTHENYKLTMSQPANCTMRLLDKNWKSYFESIKEWNKNHDKFLGKPRIPKYLNKEGRFIWEIPNNTCYTDGNKLYFRIRKLQSYKWFTQAKGRLIQVRFVPHSNFYMMEVVTEVEICNIDTESKRIASIDLGVDNFITMTNNIEQQPIIVNGKGIKSINQFYNKQRAKIQSELKRRHNILISKKFNAITEKRNARIKNYIHCTSKYIIKWCNKNNIDTLVCGINKEWKQESTMSKASNQKFISIPYDMLINQLTYKCQDCGIKFITTEESYTSGTSFLDCELPIKDNYDKSRRIKRGLFQSTKQLINSDVNGSLQIMKKVFPDAFKECYGIEGILTPIVINVA
jgi:putative transposase